MTQIAHFNPSQLDIIKSTVAKDANHHEFNLFMEACKSYGLDPFRRQIFSVVYSKDNPQKRHQAIIVSRDGLRVMASRSGDYRPASEPADITFNEELKGPTNPKGIQSAYVRLWKRDPQGDWYPVVGRADWDEFAPLKETWAHNPESGRREPTGEYELDKSGNWAKMPIVMITKCAESQALRAGWPETFGGVYTEEEMDRLGAEASASEALERHHREERERRVGGHGLLFVFDDTGKLEKIPAGQIMDRCLEFLQDADPEEVHKFRIRNEHSLRDFWAMQPRDALELKQKIEEKEKTIAAS